MNRVKQSKPRFRVGDWVRLQYGGPPPVFAQIIEDRGNLGVKGRRLHRIRIEQSYTDPVEFEMPEEEMEPAPPPAKAAVLRFLKEGGLLAMLRANLIPGPEQPKAWLTFTRQGELRHTLNACEGVLGGGPVPYFALYEDKVFPGKKDQVIRFLATFGLSPEEAEDVIRAVGTGP